MKTTLTLRLGMLLFALLAWMPQTISAQSYSTISRFQLLSILESEGYSAEEAESPRNVMWKLNGYKTLLIIAEDGASIQFYCAFTNNGTNLNRVNTWNKEKKYSRSYLDNDGDPVLELDLDLVGGVNRARIVDFLLTCRVSLNQWKTQVVD